MSSFNTNSKNIKKLRELVNDLPIRDAETFEMFEIFKMILEKTTDGYWDWDIINDYGYLKPSFVERLGFVYGDDSAPKTWKEAMLEEDVSKVDGKLKDFFNNGGKGEYRVIMNYKHKDGSLVEILTRGIVIEWDVNNKPSRMVGTYTDITNL